MHSDPVADVSGIDRWHISRQEGFRSVPVEGRSVRYLGKDFWVFPNTFWPYTDSHPLVLNLRVEKGGSVLDVGTGSGVIGVFSAYKGAGRVLAVDVNPDAIRSATFNARQHGFENVMEVRQSDLFEKVGDEQFDVITANLPFRDKPASDLVERSTWDTDFRTNATFFKEVDKYLNPGGRIYFSHASFGSLGEVERLAQEAGFSMRLLAEKTADKAKQRTFYAYLIQRVGQDGPA